MFVITRLPENRYNQVNYFSERIPMVKFQTTLFSVEGVNSRSNIYVRLRIDSRPELSYFSK